MYKKSRLSQALMLAFGGTVVLGALSTQALAQRVEITGSSIKRVEAEGALQVQTLTRADIDRTGAQTTEQLLQTISAMSSSGRTSTATGASLSTYGFTGVSLRGLGEERTLVLINGRRVAAFAGGGGAAVNVNNIPLAAVERIEVLKDGASAIYGSDAVAGVVNFILTKDFQGYQIGGTYGTPTQSGGGQQYEANFVAGWGDTTKDKWNLTVSGQYQKNKNLIARDRDFASNGNRPPSFVPTATGQGNIQGAWNMGTGANNGVGIPPYQGSGSGYGNPLASPTDRCGEISMVWQPTSSGGQPFCIFDSAPFVNLTGESEVTSLTGNFVFKINDKMEVFADGIYSKSKATTQIQPSPLRTSFLASDEAFGPLDADGNPNVTLPGAIDRVLLLRTTNPAYATAANYLNSVGLSQLVGQDLGITARVFDFGQRVQQDTSTQSRFVLGVRGEIWDQSYNVAVTSNQSKVDGSVTEGYFSQLGFAQATQAIGSDWNPWSLTQSQAFMDAIAPARYVGPTLSAKSTQTNFDATMSGDVVPMPAGTLQYAVGYQYRLEKLQQTPSAALLSGDIAGLGGATKPVDEDRYVNAVFGELNIPVIKNLDLNLAARYDDYSDVGSTTNWKGSVRWQPIQTLLLRGSYGTGFRAPTLTDLWDPQVIGTSATFVDPTNGAQGQVNEFSGGNPNLKPEESTQYSLGLVFQPLPSLSIGLDWFNIEVTNAIALPSTQEVVSQNALGNPAYAGLVTRDPLTGQIITTRTILANTGTLEAQGIDIDLRYRENLGPGTLSVSLNGTYYTKFDQGTPGAGISQKVATMVDSTGAPLISSTTDLDGQGVVLRYKQYLAATWTQGDWATTLANEYATGYAAGWDTNDNPTFMPSQTLWDLQVAWSGLKNTVLTLGARNIFDKQPALYVSPGGVQFQSGYDISQYDPRGRFVYLTGTFKF